MRQRMKCYKVAIRTIGPVFVGSGREIGKKEYVFLNRGKAGILDIQKLYAEMHKRGIGSLFEDYLLGRDGADLERWLKDRKSVV